MIYRATPKDGIAWVTGASSGIGRAVAVALARRGYAVVVTARRGDLLQTIAAEAPGARIVVEPGDVTDAAGMAALVARIEAAHGGIALAFLNVGVYTPDGLDDIGGAAFRQTFDVNIGGTVNCLAPLLMAMRARGRGQVAINASVAGYGGLPRSTAYGASKAALINMAASLAPALAAAGVTMQVVCPGFVKTPATDKNDFPMPFIMDVEPAAARICDGFERGGFEIAFPRRLAWLLKAANMLPYAAYFAVVGRVTGSGKS